MKLFSAIVALSSMSTASASLRGTDGIVPTDMMDLLSDKNICKGPKSGGLQAACDPSGLVEEYCKSGYYCEPIIGDPNQKGQCIQGGGLQASCDPADLGAGCQCGYYCEQIIGSVSQPGQCIPGGGLQASCDPNTGYGCQAGFDCELILGNQNQNGQCIPRPPPAPTPANICKGPESGGLQAACDPSGLVEEYCKSGYYCEPIIGDPNQKGQCIPGGGLQASCDPADLGAGCQCGYYCEEIIGSVSQPGQCIPGGGLQASCDPNTGYGCQAGFDCELILGNQNQNGQCIPRPPSEPTPGTRVGQGCGGQQMPNCGAGTIPMCCPPSKKKAKKGYGSKYLCVNSSGGMQAQCPSNNELDFSELVTEW